MPRLNEVWEIIKLIIDKFVEYKKKCEFARVHCFACILSVDFDRIIL